MTDREQLFYTLPYAGNHTEYGVVDSYGTIICSYREGAELYFFTRDESWDNVQYVECTKEEAIRLVNLMKA